jgi:NAD(P)H-flavin reductase
MARSFYPGWRPARVLENRQVSNGSMWIALEAVDELPAAYDPGHVLGLGLPLNDGYIRHAYTVSRGDHLPRRFEHLYRIIPRGRMTPLLAGLSAGSEIFFHGPFHTPIEQEVRREAERILLIATGTGVGPIFGYAEKALREGETRSITLYAGFHEESHMCLMDELSTLANEYSNFEWHYTVTNPSESWHGLIGRVTDQVPERIDKRNIGIYHFHLVGNGEMVHLLRRALYGAGVTSERVTIETYFNNHAVPDESAIDALAARFLAPYGVLG